MARIKAELIGDKELLRQLREMERKAPHVTNEALEEWAEDTRDETREQAPVDEGIIRQAVNYRVKKKAFTAEVGYWGKGLREAFYVWWVHDGTSRINGNPFLDRAFRRNRDVRPYLRDLVERLLK